MQQLAQRLELSEFFDFSIDDFRRAQLKKLPQVAQALAKEGVYNDVGPTHNRHGKKRFRSRSGKIEFYVDRYKDKGVDPMPVYKPPRPVPPGRFRLVVGRNAYISQSSSTNNVLLCELEPENSLWIHPEAAKAMGLVQGQEVEVASPVGAQRIKARVTEETRPDTVYMDSGFGVISRELRNVYGKGACIAELLEDKADSVTGNMAMHETLVTVRKVKGGTRQSATQPGEAS
jgi:thiosulfate reductase/polysulfide reductase chain A